MNHFVTIASRQHPKELRIVIHQPVIEHSLHWQLMEHNPAMRREVMDHLESVELIGDMLGRPEVRDQLIFSHFADGN